MLRSLLSLAEQPYRSIMHTRNCAYDVGWLRTYNVNVPVVSVGNLTLGGTGKSPLVAHIAEYYLGQGLNPAILSRGYAAGPNGTNDEARELRFRLPDVTHLQGRDRVANAARAVASHQANVIILDDGFQHRRLHRTTDIVLIDALCPWGYGHVFPRGLLRESIDGLSRADLACITRSDTVSSERLSELYRDISSVAPNCRIIELTHRPSRLLDANGTSRELSELQGRRVAAFCGIGNPTGFRYTLDNLDSKIVAWREFPDHYRYDQETIAELEMWVGQQAQVDYVLCTLKDLVKIPKQQLAHAPLLAVAVDCHVRRGSELLHDTLLNAIDPRLSIAG